MKKINFILLPVFILTFIFLYYIQTNNKNTELTKEIQKVSDLSKKIKDLEKQLEAKEKLLYDLDSKNLSQKEEIDRLKTQIIALPKSDFLTQSSEMQSSEDSENRSKDFPAENNVKEDSIEGIPIAILEKYKNVRKGTINEDFPSFAFVITTGSLSDSQRIEAVKIFQDYQKETKKLREQEKDQILLEKELDKLELKYEKESFKILNSEQKKDYVLRILDHMDHMKPK
jgi:peptidoglycan hydrolase CwlO-like protein